MKVTVHISSVEFADFCSRSFPSFAGKLRQSICCWVGAGNVGVVSPVPPNERSLGCPGPCLAISGPDGKNQFPLPEQGSIRSQNRITGVVDARRFRSGAVKLDNVKISAGA